MEIKSTKSENTLTVALAGRLDTATAPLLEKELEGGLDGVTDLKFDFSALEYISSAGLRVLLSSQKRMNKVGTMAVVGANDSIREIFDITGFSDILTIL